MLRHLRIALLPLLLCTPFLACDSDDEDTPDPKVGSIVITLSENVAGAALVQKDVDANARYINAAGNRYGVDLLEYLLSEFSLLLSAPVKDGAALTGVHLKAPFDGVLGGAQYRNAFNDETNTLTLNNVPAGDFSGLSFYWGVPEEMNFRDPDGPDGLPTEIGELMGWPPHLGDGYHCSRLNGVYDDQATDDGSFVLHMGRLDKDDGTVTNCHTKLSFGFELSVVEGQETHISLSLDVDKLLNAPEIDFGAAIGSSMWNLPTMPNHAAQAAMRDNMADVFTISVVE